MTYMSLCILRFPGKPTAQELETSSSDCSVVKKLDHLARKAGPYRVADWAKSIDLDRYYIDNCWIRVPVTLDQLKRFDNEVLAGAAELDGIADALWESGDTIAIESEEF